MLTLSATTAYAQVGDELDDAASPGEAAPPDPIVPDPIVPDRDAPDRGETSDAPSPVAPPAAAGAESTALPEAETGEGPPEAPAEPDLVFEPYAYVEAFLLWSFLEPSNGVVAYRGFDNRHATFTLSNAVLGARLAYERVYVKVALQWGHTPASYYAGETSVPPIGGTGGSDADLWRVLQEAYLGWDAPVLERGLRIEAGLFLSPIGIEGMAAHDNWNFSRSNLFFGLPFYHTGVRLTLPLDAEWSLTAAAYNGWNTLLDGNDEKSVSVSARFATPEVEAQLLYFGGVERGPLEPERGWRHLLDLTLRVVASEWLELQGQLDAGVEPWSDALYAWVAAALYAKVRPIEWLEISVRGDVFWDGAPYDAGGLRRAPIFFPVEWVSSGTATLTFRPLPQLAFRVEYRHDEAAAPMFYAGEVVTDAAGEPIPTHVRQDTLGVSAIGYLR